MAVIDTIEVKVKVDMSELVEATQKTKTFLWHFGQCIAKLKRESRILYRLRRWFLSLRWVNNFVWRRGNKKLIAVFDYNNKWQYPRLFGLTTDSTWGHWYDQGACVHGKDGKKQNTGLLPDYPSINELDSTRPEDKNA